MSFTATPAEFDRRQQQLTDDSVQRAIRIRNLQNMDTLYAPLWRAKQEATYQSVVPLTQDPDLGQILSESVQYAFNNPMLARQQLYERLLKIATSTIANYLSDPNVEPAPVFTDNEVRVFLSNFSRFLKDMSKGNVKGFDISQLIQSVKRQAANFDFGETPQDVPTGIISDQPPMSPNDKQNPRGPNFGRPPSGGDDGNDDDGNSPGGGQGGRRLSVTEAFSRMPGNRYESGANTASTFAAAHTPGHDPFRELWHTARQNTVFEERAASAGERTPRRNLGSEFASLSPAEQQAVLNSNVGATPTTGVRPQDSDVLAFKARIGAIAERVSKIEENSKQRKQATAAESPAPESVTQRPKPKAKRKTEAEKLQEYTEQTNTQKMEGKGIEWKKLKEGVFTRQFEKFQKSHPEIQSLEDFSHYILSHSDEFPKSSEKRARFYLNVIMKFHKKKPVRIGRGATQRPSTSRHYLGNYYVDLNKLGDNVLCVRYAKTDAQLPQMKVQRVSNGVKENVEDILKGKFDKRIYNLLNTDDKRLVKRFAKCVRMSLDLDDDLDKDFQQEYEVLLGEYASGNNNPQLKAQLKQFVVKAISENLIPRHQAMLLLYQLSL